MHLRRSSVVLLFLALLPVGCGRPEVTPGSPPVVATVATRYPVRTDLLAVGDLGTPPKWYSAGYPPLRTVRLGDRSPDPEFAAKLRPMVGKALLDPQAGLTAPQRDDIGRALDAYFGTPAAPTVHVPTAEKAAELKLEEYFATGLPPEMTPKKALAEVLAEAGAAKPALGLDDGSLARGGVLYRRWCLQCHGPTGGGDGAHAVEMSAMPRDYRQGVFKFVTTFPTAAQPRKGEKGKARKEDIRRTIRKGIEGSMMPPFTHFTDEEVDDLAGYVIHLSVRGEVEYQVMRELLNVEGELFGLSGPDIEKLAASRLLPTLGNWARAEASPIPVPPENCPTEIDRLESAVRGYKTFAGSCAGCHQDYGRAPQLKYDVWGTVVQPRNLVLGVYRGGRRGEDLYARVYAGIYPSTMPDSKALTALAPTGKPDAIWDVVHFVQALGDPRQRKLLQQLDPNIKIDP